MAVYRCWGKTGASPEDFHPAIYHMLDVGHIAQALLAPGTSCRWRNVLESTLGAPAQDLAGWVPALIALHDIGKISAVFQGKVVPQRERLETEGFAFPRQVIDLPHALIGQASWVDEIPDCWPGPRLPLPLSGVCRDMVGGHHGRFTSRTALGEARTWLQACEPIEWRAMRKEAAEIVLKTLSAGLPVSWPVPVNPSSAVLALTGFTILCDWLGSDSAYFIPCPEVDLDRLCEMSRKAAGCAVSAAGFVQGTASALPTHFSALYPDRAPGRPLQQAIDRIPDEMLAGPSLAIIEAPTGEGKTEAALALAHRIGQLSGTNELYYALPTTATSNQMYARVQDYLQRLGLDASVRLIHSQAFLMEDDLRLQPLGDRSSPADPQEWFAPKKRALLAPFGVGTVDQGELAVLNVRHVALRLLGLAGKVMVLDEVHAYDTYMTTIIERLLEWAAALDVSVILLSATLPQTRRQALMQAYVGKDVTHDGTLDAYPSVLIAGLKGVYQDAPEAYQPERSISLGRLSIPEDDPEEAARWLLDQVVGGGCACWIANTVDRAQRIYAGLRRLDPQVDALLLHARFPLETRQALEERLTLTYGPRGVRPTRGIVVGTQVLEQSLDLDFDVMASDLAPVDLLLQRAGRLHRHARPRPARHSIPCLYIDARVDEVGELDPPMRSSVYAEYLLRLTWQAFSGREKITLPADYRPLIEAVYSAVPPEQDTPLWDAWERLKRECAKAEQEAQLRLIPRPSERGSIAEAMARMEFKEEEMERGWIVAQTRLGEDSLTVIPLERQNGSVRLVPHDLSIDPNRLASREVELHLLRHAIHISNREAVQALRAQADTRPTLFQKSALLKDCFPLWLTQGQAALETRRGQLLLTLDPELGLVLSREGG